MAAHTNWVQQKVASFFASFDMCWHKFCYIFKASPLKRPATCLSLLELMKDKNRLYCVEQKKSARRRVNTWRMPCAFLLSFVKQTLQSWKPKKNWTPEKRQREKKRFHVRVRNQSLTVTLNMNFVFLLLQTTTITVKNLTIHLKLATYFKEAV